MLRLSPKLACGKIDFRMKLLPPPPILLEAYAQGYFPMPDSQSDEIHWYRPDPRAILPLESFHISRSFGRFLKKQTFKVTLNRQFKAVMEGCSQREPTWINSEFKKAYFELHQWGYAHSIEVWDSDRLVGGLYGVQLGGAFFAESMFSHISQASKLALFRLTQLLNQEGFSLLEVQFSTPHLKSLGVIEISDSRYQHLLKQAILLSPTLSSSVEAPFDSRPKVEPLE